MSLLSLLGIATASAAPAAGSNGHSGAAASFTSLLPMLIIFIVAVYFLIIRPQSKRAKEQRSLLDGLSVGDEIMTAGGIVGRLTKIKDNFVNIAISKDTEITMQKKSIASILPKGTLESMEK